MTNHDFNPTPLPEPRATATCRRRAAIGLPACANASERRFPLTPEAVGLLVDKGFEVIIERGAGAPINYTDEQYAAAGAEIASRTEAFATAIVIYLAPVTPADMAAMKRGAMLLTLLTAALHTNAPEAILSKKILTVALDLVRDKKDNTPFADILSEIDGRASIALAASLLADTHRGKGILLGGVAGVIPCEVTIIGSGIAAVAAARSAQGLGAMVRMFDDDIYSLRRASMELAPGAVTSVLHPKVLTGALRSADVVVVTCDEFIASRELTEVMKRGVVVFDLTRNPGRAFPAMRAVDLASVGATDPSATLQGRLCLINAGSAVARTAAMALGNSLNTLLRRIGPNAPSSALQRLGHGFQCAALTYLGKTVNPLMAEVTGTKSVDISIFLTLS